MYIYINLNIYIYTSLLCRLYKNRIASMLFSAHDSFKNEGKKDEETQHLSHRIPTALQYECTRSTEPKNYFHFKKGVGFSV